MRGKRTVEKWVRSKMEGVKRREERWMSRGRDRRMIKSFHLSVSSFIYFSSAQLSRYSSSVVHLFTRLISSSLPFHPILSYVPLKCVLLKLKFCLLVNTFVCLKSPTLFVSMPQPTPERNTRTLAAAHEVLSSLWIMGCNSSNFRFSFSF